MISDHISSIVLVLLCVTKVSLVFFGAGPFLTSLDIFWVAVVEQKGQLYPDVSRTSS